MPSENLELIRRGAEALSRGDVEDLVATTTEDVVVFAARSAVEGPYIGHDGLRKFVADNAENFELFEVQLSEVRDLGARVLAIGTIHIRGRGGGVETDVPLAGVFTIRDGKVSRWEDFRERKRALEAVGLRE